MFNFLASKHRQPPEYRPHEDDDEEGQVRTARSVTELTEFLLLLQSIDLPFKAHLVYIIFKIAFLVLPLQACFHGATAACEIQTPQGHLQGNCRSLQVRPAMLILIMASELLMSLNGCTTS